MSRLNKNNHYIDYSKGISSEQKSMIKDSVKNNPIATANHHRSAMERLSPEHRIQKNKLKLVKKAVAAAQTSVLEPFLLDLAGKYHDLGELGQRVDFATAIRKHYADPVKNYLGLRDVYSISCNIHQDIDLN